MALSLKRLGVLVDPTVDGRNPANQLICSLSYYFHIWRVLLVLHIPGGAGFLPSTVFLVLGRLGVDRTEQGDTELKQEATTSWLQFLTFMFILWVSTNRAVHPLFQRYVRCTKLSNQDVDLSYTCLMVKTGMFVTAAFVDADPQRAPSLLVARQLQKPGRRSSKVPHG